MACALPGEGDGVHVADAEQRGTGGGGHLPALAEEGGLPQLTTESAETFGDWATGLDRDEIGDGRLDELFATGRRRRTRHTS